MKIRIRKNKEIKRKINENQRRNKSKRIPIKQSERIRKITKK